MLEASIHPADERFPCHGEHRSYLVPSPLPPAAQDGSIEAVALYMFKWPCHISPWQANEFAKRDIVPIGCKVFHIGDQYAFPVMRPDGALYCVGHNHEWAVRNPDGCPLLEPRYVGPRKQVA